MMKNRKYAITFSQLTLTQQHSKDAADINKIMARYIKTGVIDHVAKYQGQYLDNSDIDYHSSQNIIIKADSMFAELPSNVRREFQNDPATFLKFVHDPDNHKKLVELGLAHPRPENLPETPAEPAEVPTTPAPVATAPPDSTTP